MIDAYLGSLGTIRSCGHLLNFRLEFVSVDDGVVLHEFGSIALIDDGHSVSGPTVPIEYEFQLGIFLGESDDTSIVKGTIAAVRSEFGQPQRLAESRQACVAKKMVQIFVVVGIPIQSDDIDVSVAWIEVRCRQLLGFGSYGGRKHPQEVVQFLLMREVVEHIAPKSPKLRPGRPVAVSFRAPPEPTAIHFMEGSPENDDSRVSEFG